MMEKATPKPEVKNIPILPTDLRTYKEISTMRYNIPYVFELIDGKRSLSYYGARHCHSPQDPILKELEQKFIKTRPDILFIEGTSAYNHNRSERERLLLEMDRAKLIKDFGEPGLMIRLAVETETEYICPEPEYGLEVSEVLREGFGKEDVFAYYMYRVIYQYRQIPNPPYTVEEYVQKFINSFKTHTNWSDFDYSIESLKRIGLRIWGKNSDFRSGEFRIDPIPWENKKSSWTVVNDVCSASAEIRERLILQSIVSEMVKGKNVFVVYGSTHAVRQEPGLRRVFNLLSQKPSA